MMKKVIINALTWILTLGAGSLWAAQNDLVMLGEHLYKDKNLSRYKNQSCMTCHHPAAGYVDPENRRDPVDFPVSNGSDPSLFGGRNAPSAAYGGFSPVFAWDDSVGGYMGGMFWDGRATGALSGDPLAEQALGPFLNPVEMAMTKEAVVAEVAASNYARLFERAFPGTDFSDTDGTYDNIGIAIAAYERSTAVTRFNSKFDQFWRVCQQQGIEVSGIDANTDLATLPADILTVTQLQGLVVFNDPNKGNCAACHTTTDYIAMDGTVYPPLFTDYTYDNLGIPTNWRVYALAGGAPPDLGLGGRLDEPAEYGKFKVPTLRNVAKSPPYGHNGYFPTLKEVVNFYNTRDVPEAGWDAPEVPDTMNTTELGDLGLTRLEEWQLVAFLKALTDQSPFRITHDPQPKKPGLEASHRTGRQTPVKRGAPALPSRPG
jgi:cytochrome c peroxidase